MSKKFDIHDWQAKQAKKLLNEEDNLYQPDLSVYGNKDDDNDLNIDGDVERKINNFIRNMGDDLGIPLQHVVYNIIRVIKSQNYDGLEEHHAGDYNPGFLKQSVSTFLDKLKKKTNEGKDYKTVEKIMEKHFSAKKANEASMTGGTAVPGGGTKINLTKGGSPAGPYASNKAFKKKKKK